MKSLGTYSFKHTINTKSLWYLFLQAAFTWATVLSDKYLPATARQLGLKWHFSDETQVARKTSAVAKQCLSLPEAGVRPCGYATAVTHNLRTALTQATQFPC